MIPPLRKEILLLAKHHRTFSAGDIATDLGKKVSRQYISLQLRRLVEDEELVKVGHGRWTRYALPRHAEKLSDRASARLQNNNALDEYRVYADIKRKQSSIRKLPENVEHILSHGFTEMLNNAIDHSGSSAIVIAIEIADGTAKFIVSDSGVGIFRNIMGKRKLANELEAIQDLTKGKVTTQKARHSGEGIFFTSKAADVFVIESYGYRLRIDNGINDIFIEKLRAGCHKGTAIHFEVDARSPKNMGQIFRQYSVDPDEGDFDVTEIKVRLFRENTRYVSRSQAKRLLVDLDKFKRIILDFENVETVGQGFADEIFRVFATENPTIELKPINMNDEVSFMVNRVDRPNPSLFK